MGFKQDGLEIIRGVIPDDLANSAAAEIDFFYRNNDGKRVVNLHMTAPSLMEVVTSEAVAEWVTDNCFIDPAVYTTLSFQTGTEQPIHRDVPHFMTQPLHRFIGVWYALEDANLNNGCLRYYKGGHSLPEIDGPALAREMFPNSIHLSEKQIDECMEEYQSRVSRACVEDGLQVEHAIVQKGDVVIWDARLPHGGSPILDKTMTRRSIVAHCVPIGTRVYNARQYFNLSFRPEKLSQPIVSYSHTDNGWWVQKQPSPFFQDSYI